MDKDKIRLTQTVQKGGCAAKLPAGTLKDVLTGLNLPEHPNLLVSSRSLDDACVWALENGRLSIHTLDFFTPIVDCPRDFGAIAATNALSDIYAMGGKPEVALAITAFPTEVLPITILSEVLEGAIDRIRAAGAVLGGGHTIDDDTLKFGLSVTGSCAENEIWTNAGAKPGDVLILTKALGTGTLTGAAKHNEIDPESLGPALVSMKQLNNLNLPTKLHASVHAATDITGFGLLGHGMQMAKASQCTFSINAADVPALPQAMTCLAKGLLTKAHKTNSDYVAPRVGGREKLPPELWHLLVDPQTSGGLLLAIAADAADQLVDFLRPEFLSTTIVGRVLEEQAQPLMLNYG